jgi:hypothetical protein
MSTWNYRVLQHEGSLAIHAVHYDEHGKPSFCTERPSYPAGTTVDELKQDVKRYVQAIDEPILNYSDF